MEEIIYPDPYSQDLFPIIQKNIVQLESTFKIDISLRGNKIMFEGESRYKKTFKKYLKHILELIKKNGDLNEDDFNLSLSLANDGKIEMIGKEIDSKSILKLNGKEVTAKTYNQSNYIKAMKKSDLVFSIGPAGTGKTFLAIAVALHYLLKKGVERIVLTRPVVEAGEKLGFLPGDIQQKVNPYFRPLYDALYHFIGFEKTSEYIEKGIIELAPLAYMRGRTINKAFIILDEGQNTSNSQMKMFLTRFGQNSKVVVTADISQIDLTEPKKSGIFKAIKILKSIKGIRIITLNSTDVIRHELVQKIIEAYEKKKNEV
ncbi:MAG: PhoH family protein [Candidatus Aminicenantes bacterium]|nr:PhoH family protein [Candidatus Aminicenantes bacterium]